MSTSYSGSGSEYEYSYNFNAPPLKNINAGISVGVAFEVSGFIIGMSYDWGLLNLANNDYWSSKRMNITQYTLGGDRMKEHSQE